MFSFMNVYLVEIGKETGWARRLKDFLLALFCMYNCIALDSNIKFHHYYRCIRSRMQKKRFVSPLLLIGVLK